MGFTYDPDPNPHHCELFDDSVTSTSSSSATSTCSIKSGDAVHVKAMGNTITNVRLPQRAPLRVGADIFTACGRRMRFTGAAAALPACWAIKSLKSARVLRSDVFIGDATNNVISGNHIGTHVKGASGRRR